MRGEWKRILPGIASEDHWLSTPRGENALGKYEDDGNFYSQNISRILDNLLEGYDNRLRPGFGGKRQNFNLPFLFCFQWG